MKVKESKIYICRYCFEDWTLKIIQSALDESRLIEDELVLNREVLERVYNLIPILRQISIEPGIDDIKGRG